MKERWKKLHGFPYIVSDHGRVQNILTQKFLKGYLNPKGYRVFKLRTNAKKIKLVQGHRLVAKTFIPNKKRKPQVNHIDCNKSNNFYKNLEWVTPKENSYHAKINGLYPCSKGENNNACKLKKQDVLKIKKAYKNSKNFSEVAQKFNISRKQVSNIVKGKSWGHLNEKHI